jgi:hypothetical protein
LMTKETLILQVIAMYKSLGKRENLNLSKQRTVKVCHQ